MVQPRNLGITYINHIHIYKNKLILLLHWALNNLIIIFKFSSNTLNSNLVTTVHYVSILREIQYENRFKYCSREFCHMFWKGLFMGDPFFKYWQIDPLILQGHGLIKFRFQAKTILLNSRKSLEWNTGPKINRFFYYYIFFKTGFN